MRDKSLRFLEKLLNTPSPSGREAKGQRVWLNYAGAHADETFTDDYGNAVAVFNKGGTPRLMLCAHADEIALIVNYIDENGYIFAEELKAASGIDVDLRREGTLVLALSADDQARLAHRFAFQKELGLPLEWINAAETRRREPHLAANLAGAVWSPQDHQVDNRKLTAALRIACERAGATIREHEGVRAIASARGRATGIVTEQGEMFEADAVVLAAGAWSRAVEGLDPALRPPVRPVKGQMLSLRMDPAAPLLNHVVWAPGVYLVPRRGGTLILGATVEEKGFDCSLTAGGMLTLLEAAWRAVPAIEELAIEETWVGHRPGSRDDAPILGHAPLDGLVYATGHHRNGVLLAPVTADSIARLILDGETDPAIRPFGFERFAPARAAE